MKLRKGLDCRKKLFGLIITFCRSSFRKSKKLDKLFEEKFNFEDTQFPDKIKDVHKIEKKDSISFGGLGYVKKLTYPI